MRDALPAVGIDQYGALLVVVAGFLVIRGRLADPLLLTRTQLLPGTACFRALNTDKDARSRIRGGAGPA